MFMYLNVLTSTNALQEANWAVEKHVALLVLLSVVDTAARVRLHLLASGGTLHCCCGEKCRVRRRRRTHGFIVTFELCEYQRLIINFSAIARFTQAQLNEYD
jgi:hypothetical protein